MDVYLKCYACNYQVYLSKSTDTKREVIKKLAKPLKAMRIHITKKHKINS